MRFTYKLLLGLFLFNAFLTLFSPIFASVGTNISDNAAGYTDSDIAQYDPNKGIVSMMTTIFVGNTDSWSGLVGILAFTGINAIAFVWALKNKNYVFIGVSLFVSLFVTLYIRLSSVIVSIGTNQGNYIVVGIIGIVGVAIGLILTFNVVDMFAPASARE